MTPGGELGSRVQSVLLVGDIVGIPRVLRHLDANLVKGMMAAEIRPQYLDRLKVAAAELNVPFLIQPPATSHAYPGFVRSVQDLAPDLIFCDSYSMLLRREILAVPRFGAINVHGGILPDYRGSNPIQWAIINDEREAGVTMHYMDEGIDSGDVIASRRVPLLFTDTWRDVLDRIDEATHQLLIEQLPAVISNNAVATPQEAAKGRRNPRRKPEDGKIDWNRPVRDIYNLVRALVSPLPGAFDVVDGGKRVVSDYRTPTEIATLKQAALGHAWPSSKVGRITIDGEPSTDAMRFGILGADGASRGSAELAPIDYDGHTAISSVSLRSRDHSLHEGVHQFLTEFAGSELRVRTLRKDK